MSTPYSGPFLAYLWNLAFSNPEAAEEDKVIDGYIVPRKVRATSHATICS
jgi:hypothetical protein